MNIECIGFQHAFNNQKRRDYHRNPSAIIKWIVCEHYICPQRYQRIQTEIRLGGAYKIPQPSQEGPVKAEHPGTKFPEVLPPIRTPVGSPVVTTSKNLLVEGPENPQESEVEEEGSFGFFCFKVWLVKDIETRKESSCVCMCNIGLCFYVFLSEITSKS